MFRILLTWTFQFEAEEEFCNNGSASKMGFTSWQASRYQILAVSIAFSTGSLIPIFWGLMLWLRFFFLVDVLFFGGVGFWLKFWLVFLLVVMIAAIVLKVRGFYHKMELLSLLGRVVAVISGRVVSDV